MAAILGTLASYVQNMLMEMAKEEIHMLLGVTNEVDKMGIKLEDIKNILTDAERRNITDLSVQAWVRELRSTMYDATDIIDLCQLKAMEQGPSKDIGCLNPLLFCMQNPLHAHDIGSRIKKLNKRLDDIKARSTSFNFINLGSYEEHGRKKELYDCRTHETSCCLDESSLVGEKIMEDTTNLVEMLTSEEKNINGNKLIIFAIVGVGGIGKTTLAKKIFDHEIIQQKFQKKIWLSSNQGTIKIELLKRAVMEVRGNHQSGVNTVGALEQSLIEALDKCKTLLVMDDVWDHEIWDDVLKTPLVKAVAQGSRVLITTRHVQVAQGMMAQKPYHHIDKLEPQDAWLLLKKQVVGNENDESHIEMLKDIGMEIVQKCDGLPLAVKVMGGLLRFKNSVPREWIDVLSKSTWSESQMPPALQNAIYLSYEDLHRGLKPCFLHYSLLPKGRVFYIHEIVGMWISEGFVHGDSHQLEELGREYYHELIQRNLIEPNTRYTDQQVSEMHDLVRLFCQYVVRDEALVAHNKDIDITGKLRSQKFIQLSLKTEALESKELEWKSLQSQVSLRTLISVGHLEIKPNDSLVSFSSLRTLHIEYADLDTLIESLCELRHLRYLSINYSNTSRLPENIGKMKFLQYVSLLYCENFVGLPNGITKLPQLRYLNLAGTKIKNIPRGFSGLTNLRKLYGFPAYMDGSWCSLEELGPLSQLTILHITGMENVSSSTYSIKASLCKKARLSHLHLSCSYTLQDGDISDKEQQQRFEEVYDELCPPRCLDTLTLEGYIGQRLPMWMMLTEVAPLGSLRTLIMENLPCCSELPNGLCQLPFLEILKIDSAPVIKSVGHEFLGQNRSRVGSLFPRLKELILEQMVEWEEWKWEEQVQAMTDLEFLCVESCKLGSVPPGLALHAKALKKLCMHNVRHLKSLENFPSVVHLQVVKNVDLERISNLQKLKTLVISGCPKMMRLEDMPSLDRLHLEDYHMDTIPRYVKGVKPRQLLLDCALPLLTSLAAAKLSPEWDKFNHINQVKAYADDHDNDNIIPRKWYVLYTRSPFHFDTNISRADIKEALDKHMRLRNWAKCPIDEDEWWVGRQAYDDKRLPLCVRFSCNAHRHLYRWLRRACLHCNEIVGIASFSHRWMDPPVYTAGLDCWTRYGRLEQQKQTSGV